MNILIAIVVLGVLVFIHELGHFIAAKLCGVYVEKFSLGFGPRLAGKKFGETDYCISAFPLGGYVKMYGESRDDEEGQNESSGVDPELAQKSFAVKPAWQRALIIVAGPVANILLAVAIFWGLFMNGYPDYSPVIGSVETGSPAEKAGLIPGDRIAYVDGKPVKSWGEFQSEYVASAGKTLNITLENGKTFDLNVESKTEENVFGDKITVGYIGTALVIPPVVGTVHGGMPAEKAGLKKGDRIVSIDGITVTSWKQVASYIRDYPERELIIKLIRNGEEVSLNIVPQKSEVKDASGATVSVGLVGINPAEGDVIVKHGLFTALYLGFQKSYEFTKLVFIGFIKLLERAVPADSLGGPIMIVQLTADSAQSGLTALLTFMAIISVNLAVFNLLPIPILDGGHLLVILLESVSRRKLSPRFIGGFQMAGLTILLCLMVFAFYNDLARIFFKH